VSSPASPHHANSSGPFAEVGQRLGVDAGEPQVQQRHVAVDLGFDAAEAFGEGAALSDRLTGGETGAYGGLGLSGLRR